MVLRYTKAINELHDGKYIEERQFFDESISEKREEIHQFQITEFGYDLAEKIEGERNLAML